MQWDLAEDTTLRKYLPTFLSIFILSVVIMDIVWPDRIRIHWQMVVLIGMLGALPFVPLIKRVSYGELEVGLSEEAKKTQETVEREIPVPEGIETSEYLPDDIPEKIYDLYETSPIAAVAMLRTELEVVLREIADEEDFQRDTHASFYQLVEHLKRRDILDTDTINALADVRVLANKAVHEKNLTALEAQDIISVGLNALERLYYYKAEGELKEST